MAEKTDLFLIHGAWSSPTSFNYLISVFSKHPEVNQIHAFSYNSTENVSNIIEKANEQVKKIDNDVILVGHSLGGIISAGISKNRNVKSLLTISSPLSGLKYNRLLMFYLNHRSPVLEDIMENAPIIQKIHSNVYSKPMTMIVSTSGFNPVIFEPNDGVVTVSSQIKWKPKIAQIKTINSSHHESLQHTSTIVELGRLLQKKEGGN